jgi:serine/threonine protein kinase
MVSKLGAGAFGEVWKALLDEEGTPSYVVAVKSVKGDTATGDQIEELMAEALIMAQILHDNVVCLIGVSTAGQDTMIVTQFCEHGSLEVYLRKEKKIRNTRSGKAENRLVLPCCGRNGLHR